MELSQERLILKDKIELLQQKLSYIETLENNRPEIEKALTEILSQYKLGPNELHDVLVQQFDIKLEKKVKRKRTTVTPDLINLIKNKVAEGGSKVSVAEELDISPMVVYRAAAGEYDHIIEKNKKLKVSYEPMKKVLKVGV